MQRVAEERARQEEQARMQREAEERARQEEQARMQREAEERVRQEEQAVETTPETTPDKMPLRNGTNDHQLRQQRLRQEQLRQERVQRLQQLQWEQEHERWLHKQREQRLDQQREHDHAALEAMELAWKIRPGASQPDLESMILCQLRRFADHGNVRVLQQAAHICAAKLDIAYRHERLLHHQQIQRLDSSSPADYAYVLLGKVLFDAAAAGAVSALRCALLAGADCNFLASEPRLYLLHTISEGISDASCWTTPLHAAVRAQHVRIVSSLLDNRAHVNWTDAAGRSALHYAALAHVSNPAINATQRACPLTKLLLAYGASIDARDNEGFRGRFDSARSGRHLRSVVSCGRCVPLCPCGASGTCAYC
jgi:hypothetical protein